MSIPLNVYELIRSNTKVYKNNLLIKKDFYMKIFVLLNSNEKDIEKVKILFKITNVNQQIIKSFHKWLIDSMYLVINRLSSSSEETTFEESFDKRVVVVETFIQNEITETNIDEFNKIVKTVQNFLSVYSDEIENKIISSRDERFHIKHGGALRFKRTRKNSTQKRKKEQKITQKKIKRKHQRKRRYSHKIRKQIKYYTPEKEKRSRKRPRKLARK